MKIATLATGGIGGFLAVLLTKAGHQVATIARGEHLQAIRKNGLSLEGPGGVQTVTPWIATDDTSEVGAVDAIIFGVKGDALEAAAHACLPMLNANTVTVPFLNGVEASDRLTKILPAPNVANGVAQISTTISAPGRIKQVGTFNNFIFAERDSQPSKRIDQLRAAIIEAGATAPPTDDIERDLWSKFALFSAMSGVTAAARCTVGDIIASDALSQLAKDVVTETAALARSKGVQISDSIEDDVLKVMRNLPTNMRASTAIDIEKGHPLEIEWVSGAVARLSSEMGLAAPSNATLYAVLSPYRNGNK